MAVLQKNGLSGQTERAEEEAVRFLNAVKELREKLAADDRVRVYGYLTGCPETGAVRRASLDLTRALARMRNDAY